MTTTAKARSRISRNGSSTTTPGPLKDEVVAHLRDHGETLRQEWVQAMTADGGLWAGVPTEERESESGAIYDLSVDSLASGSYQRTEEYADRMAERAARGAMGAELILSGLLTLQDVCARSLARHYLKEPDRLADALTVLQPVANKVIVIIAMAFNTERERVVRLQQEAISELSTPVLRVRDRLLIMPIIGLIDSERAMQLTEHLLGAIREFRARAVVMDITGVAAVDSKVANHLIQTVDAAKLLGTTVVMTGVSAAIAQTIVTIGIDLSRIETVGDLQGGIEFADRLLGYRVIVEDAGATSTVPGTVA